MKIFYLEVYFSKSNDTFKRSANLDVIPELGSYAKDTVLARVTQASLDDAKSYVLQCYPEAMYVHVLDFRELDGLPTSEKSVQDVVKNLHGVRVAPSKIHGFGLFADVDLNSGCVLGVLDGQIVDYEFNTRMAGFIEWNALIDNKILVRPYRTHYSFINHSRTPNAKLIATIKDSTAYVKIVCMNTILPGEEVTLDYRKEPLPEEYISSETGSYL